MIQKINYVEENILAIPQKQPSGFIINFYGCTILQPIDFFDLIFFVKRYSKVNFHFMNVQGTIRNQLNLLSKRFSNIRMDII
jgi:hypothetical protein